MVMPPKGVLYKKQWRSPFWNLSSPLMAPFRTMVTRSPFTRKVVVVPSMPVRGLSL